MIAACSSNDQVAPAISYGSAYFPNEVGDEWVYDVYDSVQEKRYSVTVRVAGTIMLPQKGATKIWTFQYPEAIDTNYVVRTNDTIVFYSKDLIDKVHVFVVPMTVGNTWFGGWLYDQYMVSSLTSKKVNGVSYDSAYLINENGNSPNYRRIKAEWFVPKLGMVERYRFEYDFSLPDIKVWSLKSSRLN